MDGLPTAIYVMAVMLAAISILILRYELIMDLSQKSNYFLSWYVSLSLLPSGGKNKILKCFFS